MAHLDYPSSEVSHSPTFSPLSRLYTRHGKRLLDVMLAVLLLPLLAPMIALLWVLVRLDGGPGFFGHLRVGQNGRLFRCYKLRSMVPDAEARLQHYLAQNPLAAAEWDRTQKLRHDPRVTLLGRILRRTSLDELPQIWNVLRGDMSLVGPRPVTTPELDRYGPFKDVYLSLRPGVTGLWQIRGRSNGCYEERLSLDRDYGQAIGLWFDIALILRTPLVLVWPTGR